MGLFKKDRVREQCAAPSFSLTVGEPCSISCAKELKEMLMREHHAVLFYAPCQMPDMNAWARALAYSSYAVIPDNSVTAEKLYKAVDRLVFSPVPKRIAGAFLACNEEDAYRLLSSDSIGDPVITVFVRQ